MNKDQVDVQMPCDGLQLVNKAENLLDSYLAGQVRLELQELMAEMKIQPYVLYLFFIPGVYYELWGRHSTRALQRRHN